VFENMRYVS